MGKTKEGRRVFKITKDLHVTINTYNGKAYSHMTDLKKNKTISLNLETIEKFRKAIPKVLKAMMIKKETSASENSDSDE